MTKRAFISPRSCVLARPQEWRSGTQRVVSLALCLMVCAPTAELLGQDQVPGGNIPVSVIGAKGIISGTVASSIGRPLRDITMQLVNPTGSVVGTTVTANDGGFRFTPMDFGLYTLQCVARKKVVGTSNVKLVSPTESVKMICAADPGYWKEWGLLTVLGAAAAAAGAGAVVAHGNVASPSR